MCGLKLNSGLLSGKPEALLFILYIYENSNPVVPFELRWRSPSQLIVMFHHYLCALVAFSLLVAHSFAMNKSQNISYFATIYTKVFK